VEKLPESVVRRLKKLMKHNKWWNGESSDSPYLFIEIKKLLAY
jgi:hypothetical protein